jgi:rhomboid protease GluP
MNDTTDPVATGPMLLRPLVIRLRGRPPDASLRPVYQLLGLLLMVAVGASMAPAFHRAFPELPLAAWLALGAAAGVAIALVLRRRMLGPADPHPIIFDGRALTLPETPRSKHRVTVELEQVEDVEVLGRGDGARIILSTRKGPGPFVFPLWTLEQPADALVLARNLIAHIAQLPDGGDRLVAMERKREVLRRMEKQRPRATVAFLALIGAMFGLQYLAGAFRGPLESQALVMVHMGANSAALLADGEWWRLFVANFLHGGTVHVVLNGAALLSLGSLMERLVGTPRFILVYLGSALAGALASDLFSAAMFSVGASTGIFGLLGAFAALSLRFGHHFPAGVRQSRRWWIVILGANAALPLLIPIIDKSAHAGGFIAGALLMYLSYPSLPHFDPSARPTLGILTATTALTLAFMIAGLQGGQALSAAPGQSKQAFLRMLEKTDTTEGQNMYAWLVAIDRDAEQDDLQRARDRAAKVVARDPSSGVMDTLATAEHRLGHPDVAADREREALRLAREARTPKDGWRTRLARLLSEANPDDADGLFHSQLARFLWARGKAQVPRTDAGADPAAISVRFEGPDVILERPEGTALYLFAELRGQDEPKGHLQLGVEADHPAPARWTIPAPLRDLLDGQVDLHILWLDAAAPHPTERGLTASPHASEVDEYP